MASRLRSRRQQPKTISKQGLSGQQGVNFIEGIVLKMGSRGRRAARMRSVIDGYIELFRSQFRTRP